MAATRLIAYPIRQSFKPGEITPEKANKVGYELAMRFTKGKHAFIAAAHVDKALATCTACQRVNILYF